MKIQPLIPEDLVRHVKRGSLNSLVLEVMKECPELKESSIRMKFANIKYLCMIHDINDTYSGKAREHYSDQNYRAFLEVIKDK